MERKPLVLGTFVWPSLCLDSVMCLFVLGFVVLRFFGFP